MPQPAATLLVPAATPFKWSSDFGCFLLAIVDGVLAEAADAFAFVIGDCVETATAAFEGLLAENDTNRKTEDRQREKDE
jgi:hypothetical protein